MFRIKTNGCKRRNAKGCGFLGGSERNGKMVKGESNDKE